MRDSLDPGRSGLSHFEGDFLKCFEEVDTWFWGQKKKKTKGGVAMNPTGMNVVCFSYFF